MPPQPIIFDESNNVFNTRKLVELPVHLSEAGPIVELEDECIYNFQVRRRFRRSFDSTAGSS